MCAEPSSVVEIWCCDNLDSSVNSLPSEIQSSATQEVTPVSETGLNECSETAPSGSVIQSESVHITVMILCFRTDMPGQTVQTQIRLLLEEQGAV